MQKFKHKSSGFKVEAAQFIVTNRNQIQTLPRMELWGDDFRPRDTSWGKIETVMGLRHVCSGDWICYRGGVPISVYANPDFIKRYEPLETASAAIYSPDAESDVDRREIAQELYNKLHDLTRYYMAEHDLSTFEVVGTLHTLAGGLTWVHSEVCSRVPEMYAEERRRNGNGPDAPADL